MTFTVGMFIACCCLLCSAVVESCSSIALIHTFASLKDEHFLVSSSVQPAVVFLRRRSFSGPRSNHFKL